MFELVLFLFFVVVAVRLIVVFRDKIRFFATGSDKGFSFSEIRSLWRLAESAGVEEPESLFYSHNLVDDAITRFIAECEEAGTVSSRSNQEFLKKLYAYRTRISLEHEDKRGLDSTKYLDSGQKVRLILPGHGVFQSEIVGNEADIIIRTPTQNGSIVIPGEDWVDRKISVYLWRKGDAAYVFDSVVLGTTFRNGVTALRISHSHELLRTQKRRSIRAVCSIECRLYFLGEGDVDYDAVEEGAGYKCLIEDVSEDGALVRVGGKGVRDSQIKLQFTIGDDLVVMFGIVRAVEYDKARNESKLHFECIHLDDKMRNQVLGYVYKVLPEKEREVFEAIAQTEEDASASGDLPPDGAGDEGAGSGGEISGEAGADAGIGQKDGDSGGTELPVNLFDENEIFRLDGGKDGVQ